MILLSYVLLTGSATMTAIGQPAVNGEGPNRFEPVATVVFDSIRFNEFAPYPTDLAFPVHMTSCFFLSVLEPLLVNNQVNCNAIRL
jgi:hypothetical protein